MTWSQTALIVFLMSFIAIIWSRYTEFSTKRHRYSELYLWLIPFSLAIFPAIHDSSGLLLVAAISILHLLLSVLAICTLIGKVSNPGADSAVRSAHFAGGLLVTGATTIWIAAATFPGMSLDTIAAHQPDHLWTTGGFAVGGVVSLAGFALLTFTLRTTAIHPLSELGFVAYFIGSVFWIIHLAFRGTVMISVARETAMSGTTAPWYEPLRAWSGSLYVIYMVMAYLAIAAYGGALLKVGWASRRWAWTSVVFGVSAMVLFLARVPVFDMPLTVQFMPFVMGLILLRRGYRGEASSNYANALGR